MTTDGAVYSIKLNYQVVAYPTEENLLSDRPMADTIGIVSDTEVTSYVTSNTKPNSPVHGMVWVVSHEDGDLGCAKQYIDGSWVYVITKIYQYGAWVELPIFYINGAYCINEYGTWKHYDYGGYGGSASHENSGVVISAKSNDSQTGSGAFYGPAQCIDFTYIKDIYATFENSYGSADFGIGVTDVKETYWSSEFLTKTQSKVSSTKTFHLDVSKISGIHYLRLVCDNDTSSPKSSGIYTKVWALLG